MALSLHLTLSAALLASGKPSKAFKICQTGLQFSDHYGIQDYYIAALHTNAGLALYQQGDRVQSKQRWIAIRQLPDFTQHLGIRLHCLIASIRLSIEEGKAKRHVPALKAIVALLEKQHQPTLLDESLALLLECAVQGANKRLANQAFELAEAIENSPLFLTVKSRWLWLTGYLQQAWYLLDNQPDTFEGFTAQAEQIRLGIVLGKLEWAKKRSAHLLTNPSFQECKDLYLFVTLCQECIYVQEPTNFLEHGVQHQWTEISLGSLHLLALRTHFQRKPVEHILQTLHDRSTQLNHRLYLALSDPALYGIQQS
jgi:tetratricopeptide (TPR) repeat protein